MKLIVLVHLAVTSLSAQYTLSQKERDSIYKNGQIHQENMMHQLGITALRPGPSGNESAPNHANYDERLANPCPDLPELLLTNNGERVRNAEDWWKKRRPEIVESFEREVYGRLPENIPNVEWSVTITDHEFVRRRPIIAKRLVGQVDNSAHPSINVTLNALLVVPANAEGPVPVLMMFGRPSFPAPRQPSLDDLEKINRSFKKMMIANDPEMEALFEKYPAYNPISRLDTPNFWDPLPQEGLSSTEQLLEAGWGYLTIEPSSIQADNSAGLRHGIIGLTNKGAFRKPDQWGALRAWAWGASRALDYLEEDPMSMPRKSVSKESRDMVRPPWSPWPLTNVLP